MHYFRAWNVATELRMLVRAASSSSFLLFDVQIISL
jgi:hypothetical protein